MPIKSLTRTQVRNVDRIAIEQFGYLGLVLMENAGRGCADLLVNSAIGGGVAIFCGKGNNGGDGYVIGRHLALRGYPVQIISLTDPETLRGDALTNFRIAEKCGLPILTCPQSILASPSASKLTLWLDENVLDADWFVDALLGTGTRGAPREPFATTIQWCNQRTGRRLAVDIPSGLDCDSGKPSVPTFCANVTATFVASKVGFESSSAQEFLGDVHVLDIGVPPVVIERALTD